MIQQTSLSAYKTEIQPTLGNRQQTVYEAIRKFPDLTNSELSAFLNWPINTVTPRVKELRDRGLVMQGKVRTCRVTGRNVIAWMVSPKPIQGGLF